MSLEKLSPRHFHSGAAAAAEVAPQNLFLWNPHWQCFAWGLAAEKKPRTFCQSKTMCWAAVLSSIDPKKGEDKFAFFSFQTHQKFSFSVVIYIIFGDSFIHASANWPCFNKQPDSFFLRCGTKMNVRNTSLRL